MDCQIVWNFRNHKLNEAIYHAVEYNNKKKSHFYMLYNITTSSFKKYIAFLNVHFLKKRASSSTNSSNKCDLQYIIESLYKKSRYIRVTTSWAAWSFWVLLWVALCQSHFAPNLKRSCTTTLGRYTYKIIGWHEYSLFQIQTLRRTLSLYEETR